MNTNSLAKTILCYGDSNTYGQKPDRHGRFAIHERWTGLLQAQLGDNYAVTEEGLGGRTTDLEHYNPDKPGRNGLSYFKPCLESHMPLDVVMIMLGTNDLKTMYERTPQKIADALRAYIHFVKVYCEAKKKQEPQIILVSPVHIDDRAPNFYTGLPSADVYDETSTLKSRQLATAIEKVANDIDCEFFDAASVAEVGDDGLHMTLESHQRLAGAFAKILSQQ